MLTAAQIVEALGDTSAVATALSAPVSTVSSWKRKNSIPSWRRPALLNLAIERGVPLGTTDFPRKADAPTERAA